MFKGHCFPKAIILQAAYFKLRFSLSYINAEELLSIRGVKVDHAVIQRWVFKFTPLVEQQFRKQILYYKCSSCNKTVNANRRTKSLTDGIHQQFAETIDSLKLSKSFQKLFSKQLEKIIQTEISSSGDKKRQLNSEINKFQEQYDKIEFRYATDEISKDIFEKHGLRLKELIEKKKQLLINLPTKKSNHKKVMKYFLKIADNPRQFYESLDYHNKRLFQNIVFPEGFRFSMKNKECRTSKMNLLFELTHSFLKQYDLKKEKTQTQKALESHLVAGIGFIPPRCSRMDQ